MNKAQQAMRHHVRQLSAAGRSEVYILNTLRCKLSALRWYLKPTRAEARAQRVTEREARRAAREAQPRRGPLLRADGQRAALLLDQGMRPRDALLIVGGSHSRFYRALRAVGYDVTMRVHPNTKANPMPSPVRSLQRAQRAADGQRALDLILAGSTASAAAKMLGMSRTRLYKAMAEAERGAAALDPLLA